MGAVRKVPTGHFELGTQSSDIKDSEVSRRMTASISGGERRRGGLMCCFLASLIEECYLAAERLARRYACGHECVGALGARRGPAAQVQGPVYVC